MKIVEVFGACMLRIEGAGRAAEVCTARHDDSDIEGVCLLADAAPLLQGQPFERASVFGSRLLA